MRFETAPPPQWHSPATVGATMRTVLYALVPALLAHVWFYGAGIILNTGIALLAGLATEALCLRLAGKPSRPFIADGSALVTAVLFAFCLPPLCPWWVTVVGMVSGVLLRSGSVAERRPKTQQRRCRKVRPRSAA